MKPKVPLVPKVGQKIPVVCGRRTYRLLVSHTYLSIRDKKWHATVEAPALDAISKPYFSPMAVHIGARGQWVPDTFQEWGVYNIKRQNWS